MAIDTANGIKLAMNINELSTGNTLNVEIIHIHPMNFIEPFTRTDIILS